MFKACANLFAYLLGKHPKRLIWLMELPSTNLNIWPHLPSYRKKDQLRAQPYPISPVLGMNNPPLPQSASVLPFLK